MGEANWRLGLAAAATLSFLLAGCATRAEVPMPVPTPTVSSSASAQPEVVELPKLLPGGTALANLPYFDYVNEQLFSSNSWPGGEAIINNLVAAGFDKSKMQITPDKTSVLRRDTDSIQFSVLTSHDCLIGQISARGYVSTVGPELSAGICLAGQTRPIDW